MSKPTFSRLCAVPVLLVMRCLANSRRLRCAFDTRVADDPYGHSLRWTHACLITRDRVKDDDVAPFPNPELESPWLASAALPQRSAGNRRNGVRGPSQRLLHRRRQRRPSFIPRPSLPKNRGRTSGSSRARAGGILANRAIRNSFRALRRARAGAARHGPVRATWRLTNGLAIFALRHEDHGEATDQCRAASTLSRQAAPAG